MLQVRLRNSTGCSSFVIIDGVCFCDVLVYDKEGLGSDHLRLAIAPLFGEMWLGFSGILCMGLYISVRFNSSPHSP